MAWKKITTWFWLLNMWSKVLIFLPCQTTCRVGWIICQCHATYFPSLFSFDLSHFKGISNQGNLLLSLQPSCSVKSWKWTEFIEKKISKASKFYRNQFAEEDLSYGLLHCLLRCNSVLSFGLIVISLSLVCIYSHSSLILKKMFLLLQHNKRHMSLRIYFQQLKQISRTCMLILVRLVHQKEKYPL